MMLGCRFDPSLLRARGSISNVWRRLAPGTGLRSPETGSQDQGYRGLTRHQRPDLRAAHELRPIRAETRATLVTAIARGRRWLDEIIAGTVSGVEQIAAREKCSIRQVHMTISLAFLAPSLVKAAIEGKLPRGIGVTRLRDAPAEWSRQYAMLGL